MDKIIFIDEAVETIFSKLRKRLIIIRVFDKIILPCRATPDFILSTTSKRESAFDALQYYPWAIVFRASPFYAEEKAVRQDTHLQNKRVEFRPVRRQ